ncbi:MAG TPA: YndJ family transporter [Opitutaceae bacterium]|nr:YndJ family transporter [Opitutaceae bacterium]
MIPAGKRAAAGAIVWLGFVAAVQPHPRGDSWAHALLLLTALVLFPLALELIAERNDAQNATRWLHFVAGLQLPAAVLLAIACWLPAGVTAALLALPWLGVTVLLAATGGVRIWRQGVARPLERLVTDAGLIYAAIGGVWTLADRAGYGPMGFDRAIVALTAVHFHYAGFLLPIFTGLVARRSPESRFVARVVVAVVLGIPAVAFGIVASQLRWGPAIETAAGVGLALAAAVVGILHVRVAMVETTPPRARVLLAIAGVSLVCGMILAALYAIRAYGAPLTWLGIPQMRALHGTINAIGFGLCGVLGWREIERQRLAAS